MLDEQIVALAKAIRQHETGNRPVSGATGELSSRYQFLPSTWKAEAGRILGDSNAPLTLENENKVAYTRLKEWKDKGFNPGQIASMWNSGNPDMFAMGNKGVGKSSANPDITFNVPAYVNSVYGLYNQYKPAPFSTIIPESKQLDTQSAKEFKPTIYGTQILPQFEAKTEEQKSYISSLIKTIGNIPASLFNFGKGLLHFLDPRTTTGSFKQLGTDIGTLIEEKKQGQVAPTFTDFLKEIPSAAKETLLPKIINNWIDVGAAALTGKDEELDKAIDEVYRTSVNDPMNIAPAILILKGVADKTGYGKQFDASISKVARPVIDTFKKTEEGIKSTAGKTAGFITSQATGLNPETITQIIFKPESFTKTEMIKVNRPAIAERVKLALDNRLKELSETGKGYEQIRQGSAIAEVKPIKITEVFDKYRIKFDENGKIIRDVETPPLKPGDITAFEDFQRIFGNEKYLSSNAFLNARATLSEMAKYDATKTGLSEIISRELRKVYDEVGKRQLPNLAKLDVKYAPEVKILKQLKKEYLNKDGTMKDGAMNKIANLTGKGRDKVLQRLERLTPGIAEDIRILKAVEDIQIAGGQKVGTYLRAGLTGGLLVSGNPIIAIAQLLISQPAIIVPLLRNFGLARGISANIINVIISKLKAGIALTAKEAQILNMSIDDVFKKIQKMKAGLSIEDISKTENLIDAKQALQKAKGLSAQDIMSKHPDINLKRDVPVTDVYGNKKVIPEGEALTPYELKGNKVLLQDGETYIVSKNQFQNIKGNAVSGEAKEFAPELKGTEETVNVSQGKDISASKARYNELVDKRQNATSEELIKISAEQDRLEKTIYSEKTKYSQYQLPEGKNYKEILIKAPKDEIKSLNWQTLDNGDLRATQNGRTFGINKEGNRWYIFEENGQLGKVNVGTLEKAKQSVLDEVNSLIPGNNFKSSHWDEPNVISHLRLNERTYKGKKVTFMEEMQSDWAREGRSKGFTEQLVKKVEPKDVEVIKGGEGIYQVKIDGQVVGDTYPRRAELAGNPNAEQLLRTEYANKHNAGKLLKEGGIPNNPLLKNWQELSVKRALKEAVDNNSEYLAWISGEQTSARYNLAIYLDDVSWEKQIAGRKGIRMTPKDGSPIGIVINEKGIITDANRLRENMGGANWEGKKLDEVLGKGLADKIMEKETGQLSGEGLAFGGEWAKNLYDKQVKNIVEDITGHRVEVIDMGLPIEKAVKQWKISINGKVKEGFAKPSDLKVGATVFENLNEQYIITDILGDGKFKAVPKGKYEMVIRDKAKIPETYKQEFDISTKKSAGQQAIKLTDEIRAKVLGQPIKLKKPSGVSPF